MKHHFIGYLMIRRCILSPVFLGTSRLSSTLPDKNESQTNYFEKEREFSFLQAFSHKRNRAPSLHKLNPAGFTMFRFKNWLKKIDIEADLSDQQFIESRHSILGSSLATAHFVVARGGRAKFSGRQEWVTDLKEMPNKFDQSWVLESIDASKSALRYEGFDNFVDLTRLKCLILAGCSNIDDWCVDRITLMFSNSLTYLDLSDCPNVTYRCLSCFYRFNKLKTLRIGNSVSSKELELACLLLEEAIPSLNIEGVNFEFSKNIYRNLRTESVD